MMLLIHTLFFLLIFQAFLFYCLSLKFPSLKTPSIDYSKQNINLPRNKDVYYVIDENFKTQVEGDDRQSGYLSYSVENAYEAEKLNELNKVRERHNRNDPNDPNKPVKQQYEKIFF